MDDLDRAAREIRAAGVDIGDGGVVGIGEAEEEFEFRVVLRGVRADGFVEMRIAAMHGLQNGERRRPTAGAAVAM